MAVFDFAFGKRSVAVGAKFLKCAEMVFRPGYGNDRAGYIYSRALSFSNERHASDVRAVNAAVDSVDLERAEGLAEAYDADAIALIAEREGKTHLLPIRRPGEPDTPLRRLVARLRLARAA